MKKLLLSSFIALAMSGCQIPSERKTVRQVPETAPRNTVKTPEKKAQSPKAPAKKTVKKAPDKKVQGKVSAGKKVRFADVKIIGKTNKSALSYAENEEMIFTFRVDFGSEKPGKYILSYIRRGDDGKSFSGKVPANKLLTVKTSLSKPGFVSVNVFLQDSNGKPIRRPDAGKRMRPIAFYAGAAVKAETLKDCGEPKDFDAFWAKQKKRLATVPFAGKVQKKLVKTTSSGSIYAVTVPAPGPRPATGYMTIPKNAKAKSLPLRVHFFGYGISPQKLPTGVSPKEIVFLLNAHGQKLGQNAAYYKEFFKSIRTEKYSYAFDPEQNKNPETCFFNGMVMRILRTLEYLKTLPEWDGRNLTVAGGSQGGLQTMWAAALDQDVTSARPSITWCCDMAGTAKARRIHGSWRIKYVPELEYYDPVFMAKRITKADVVITRAGLGDYTCPPSGLAVCYNNLATPDKTINWYQGSNHSFIPEKAEIVTWTNRKKK